MGLAEPLHPRSQPARIPMDVLDHARSSLGAPAPAADRDLSSGEYRFFFQAEDGIRDVAVTGVQTCALPILNRKSRSWLEPHDLHFPAVRRRDVLDEYTTRECRGPPGQITRVHTLRHGRTSGWTSSLVARRPLLAEGGDAFAEVRARAHAVAQR